MRARPGPDTAAALPSAQPQPNTSAPTGRTENFQSFVHMGSSTLEISYLPHYK